MEKIKTNVEKDMQEAINYIVNEVSNKYANDNNYHIAGDLETVKSIPLSKYTEFRNSSVREYKRLKRYVNKAIIHESIPSYNMMFHIMNRAGLCDKIKISETKHEEIQKAKAAWITLRDQAEVALAKYKEVKGDYYKKRLEKFGY